MPKVLPPGEYAYHLPSNTDNTLHCISSDTNCLTEEC